MTLPPPSERAFKRRLRAGFTLLELSIVLVIIGLLIGGVFVGQSLIHNAQLNGVITEYNRWQTAVKSFQQQYQTLPGDMTNATALWGVAAGTNGTDATCGNATESTTATCNGNGDGYLQWPAQGGGSGNVYESILFWKHLANASALTRSYPPLLE